MASANNREFSALNREFRGSNWEVTAVAAEPPLTSKMWLNGSGAWPLTGI